MRQYAAGVLGTLGIHARAAIPALTRTLQVPVNPNASAGEALAQIAGAAQDTAATELLPELQNALESMLRFDQFKEQAIIVRRAVEDLKRTASLAAEPWWKRPEVYVRFGIVLIAILLLNIVLVLLAIPFLWLRRVMLHPTGAKIVGLIIGKYVVTDFLIRFFRPIRMGLFRDYRRNVRNSSVLKRWENRQYIPPRLELADVSLPSTKASNEEWKIVLDVLLRQPTGRVWLLIGQSGLGKTALLENWVRQSLEHRAVPIFLPLGNALSPSEEASALMEQYGDIAVKPDAALDLLKGGRFVILLDGFNEDTTPVATREFVRQVYKSNHVIVSSQVDPKWDKFLETSSITLKPFGREELLRLMDERWVDALLNANHLSDLAALPHTAQLLTNYIKRNNRLPHLRLDIYRVLRIYLQDETYTQNLEATAWDLFRENRKMFSPDSSVPGSFCDSAVENGILTKVGTDYQFRHELIDRFYVVCYLRRQDQRSLEAWSKEVRSGLGPDHWSDALELWGEFYAEGASEDRQGEESYYRFLEEVTRFSPQIFAGRLLPQLQRLYNTGVLAENEHFMARAATWLARVAARVQA